MSYRRAYQWAAAIAVLEMTAAVLLYLLVAGVLR